MPAKNVRVLEIDKDDFIFFKARGLSVSAVLRDALVDFLNDTHHFIKRSTFSGKIKRVSVKIPNKIWERVKQKKEKHNLKSLSMVITYYLRIKKRRIMASKGIVETIV